MNEGSADSDLASQLAQLMSGCRSPKDFDDIRIILSSAVGSLVPQPGRATTETKMAALSTISRVLKRFHPARIFWAGFPHFLSTQVLDGLICEARELRSSAIRASGHSYAPGKKFANTLATSTELHSLMQGCVANSMPTGIASYVFYDQPGDGIPLHLDTEKFSINILIMLEHTFVESKSKLVVYPDGEPVLTDLQMGETVIFDGAGLIHGREKLGIGEKIMILTIGYSYNEARSFL